MSLPRGPNSPPFARIQPPPRPKEGPVLAVGGRAIVTAQSGSDRVTLTDDGGTSALATISDGVEVEIVAWRPRRGATRYRVVSKDGRFDGWVGAANLKPCPLPPPPKPVVIQPPTRPALPIRAARATSPRSRTTPPIAEGAAIKSATRAVKSRRIGSR